MGFSERELVNINSAALQAMVLDSNSAAVWYEKVLAFQFVLPSSKVWTETASIPSADTLAQARTNATANPTIIQDLSQNASAVRLGEVPGTNKATWACYGEVVGVPTPGQPIISNWILPQLISNPTGNPSNGYTVKLYNGDPNAGGTLINPGDGQTGSGEEKSVGWVFNYASGSLLLSSDFYTRTDINSNTFDPYIVGFRYIGITAGGGGAGGTIGGSIANTQVAYGTGADQIGGEAGFTYDSAANLLEVEKVTTTGNIDAGSLTVNSNYTFPTADGSSGQTLVTDGAGGIVFGSPSNIDFSVVLDESVVAGDVIRLSTSNDVGGNPGRGRKALATTGDNLEAIGVAASTGNIGDTIGIVLFGVSSITFAVAPTTAQIGKDIYLSSVTSGQSSFSAPTTSGTSVIKIGKLLFADGASLTQTCKISIDFVVGIS